MYLIYLYIFSFYDSLIKWNYLSIFLDQWWDIGFFVYAMAQLLLQYKAINQQWYEAHLVQWWTFRSKQPLLSFQMSRWTQF
jgi:hypothetical protein